MEDKKYFYCYSYKLMKFLQLLNERYEYAGKHSNGNTFWAFPLTEAVSKKLELWDAFKNISAV